MYGKLIPFRRKPLFPFRWENAPGVAAEAVTLVAVCRYVNLNLLTR